MQIFMGNFQGMGVRKNTFSFLVAFSHNNVEYQSVYISLNIVIGGREIGSKRLIFPIPFLPGFLNF